MSEESQSNINYWWSSLFIEELIRSGCTHFVIAPGSRSTPLVGTIARNARASHTITFDERSAGFFAVGHAKASKMPAALIVTSGTAVANLMPAVVEASLDRIPMIVLTADRPWELRDVQANQTIFQSQFFGVYTNWFFELPCPDEKIPSSMLQSAANYAVYRSCHPIAGPVHINCLFRDPLAPLQQDFKTEGSLSVGKHAQPRTLYYYPQKANSSENLKSIANLLNQAQQGLLVIGAVKNNAARQHILELARTLGWPICADISSGLRQNSDPLIISHDHHVWLNPEAQKLQFDLVLQVGGRLLSKTIEQMLQARAGLTHILVDDHPQRSDPGLTVTHRVESDLALWGLEQKSLLHNKKSSGALLVLKAISNHVSTLINNILEEGEHASEPFVARHISRVISSDTVLMACTSMPIRDYHMFAASRMDGGPEIVVNRGASGIDGLMSTAMGFAQAALKRTTVLIGDLAFMHDANALSLLKQISKPVCIVVINNQGGAIFSFLPIAQFPDILNPFVNTPHDHDLGGLAKAFGVNYRHCVSKKDFINSYQEAQSGEGHMIIEVASEREANFLLHERIRLAASEISIS